MPWVKYTTKVKSVIDFSVTCDNKTHLPDATGKVTFNSNKAKGSVMDVDYEINAPTGRAYDIEYTCVDTDSKAYKDNNQPSPVKGQIPGGNFDQKTININID